MSFSGAVKGELCQAGLTRKCCTRAEAYGVLLFCNSFTEREIRIVTACVPFSVRLPALFRKGLQVEFDQISPIGPGKRVFTITSPDKLASIRDIFGAELRGSPAHHINFAMLEDKHCRNSFLRGALLAGGAISDPRKSYHLELITTHYSVSRELVALLHEANFTPKQTTRSSSYLTYFKNSGVIENFLLVLGAKNASMEVMNTKAEKHLRGSVNRRVNCDAANVDKSVDAAQVQMEAIYTLEKRGMLLELPDKLKEAVDLRMAHPELTLTQLAEICDPPVSKSAFNHRLRKLIALART